MRAAFMLPKSKPGRTFTGGYKAKPEVNVYSLIDSGPKYEPEKHVYSSISRDASPAGPMKMKSVGYGTNIREIWKEFSEEENIEFTRTRRK